MKKAKLKFLKLFKRDKYFIRFAFSIVHLLAICSLLVYSLNANAAPKAAKSPCDPAYWSSLKSRAWLESERELTFNQSLIFKPDSVLEYTCFNRFLNLLAQEAESMFSETTRWGPVLSSSSMDQALQTVVGSAVQTWITKNFEETSEGSYDLLGGRLSGLDYTPGEVTGGDYNCDLMNNVWRQAKCMDFLQNEAEDGFYNFGHFMTADDKRFLPQRCPGIQARWEGNIGNSYDFPLDDTSTTGWIADNVVTYQDRFDPESCSKPIETGLIITQSTKPLKYYEKICVTPGCYYKPSSLNQGSCVKND